MKAFHKNLIVENSTKVHLKDFETSINEDFKDKEERKKKLNDDINQLKSLQDILYAHDHYGVLIIFQAMDAAGKDSTIKHVMSGVNPQGCFVYNFKQPSTEELDHDYLWRAAKLLPRRGDICIFNRSYYEEVLITRVHKQLIINQNIPGITKVEDITESFFLKRYEQIRNFEKHLVENGTIVLKFFLHVSKEEQKERFLKRINREDKNWKFSMQDVEERKYWDDYQSAYEQAISNTSTEHAPWHIIPADHKWYMRSVVGDILIHNLKKLNMHYPLLSSIQQENLAVAKKHLENE